MRLFGGGVLGALRLEEWFKGLPEEKREKLRFYFSKKAVKDLSFPFKASQLERGRVKVPYSKRTFLGTLAQTALLEGDEEFARWLYEEALKQEGTPFEELLLLSDLLLLVEEERARKVLLRLSEVLPACAEELKRRGVRRLPSAERWLRRLGGKEAEALRKVMREAGLEGS